MFFKSLLPEGPVIRNASWMLVGLVVRLCFQLWAFILLAQTLGPSDFGAFAGTLALATLLSPFIELGGSSLIVRDITAGVATQRALGNSLMIALLALPVGILIFAVLKIIILPSIDWQLVWALGLAEFLGGRLFWLACSVHVAHEMLWRNAVLEAIWGGFRLAMVGGLAVLQGDVYLWGWLFLAQSVAIGVVALGWVSYTWGIPTAQPDEVRARFGLGWSFAVGQAAQGAYTDLDKAMLARLSTLEITGIYAAAYRFIPLAFLPVNAFLNALYPQFFRAGQAGTVQGLALKVAGLTGLYGMLATCALWFMAPWLPLLFGAEFSSSVDALRLLAFIPLFQGLYTPFAIALTGSDRQDLRSRGELLALGGNLVLNLLLIPSWGWAGAAWATLISQMILLVGFSVLVLNPVVRP